MIVMLAVHLLAMNVASAGPLLGIWLGRRPADTDSSLRDEIGRRVAWLSVWAMFLGILTGGGLMCFSASAGLLAAIDRLPNRALWFAALELAFSLACLLLYAGFWNAFRRHRWWHALIALLSSSNLLYHFPPLMSVLGKLAADPGWAKAEILNRQAILPLMARSEVLALTTHFTLASVAVAAVAVLWLLSGTYEDRWEKLGQPIARQAAWTALLASALQVPVGVWLLISLPQSDRMAMMGNHPVASLTFVGSLLLTFVLLQRLLIIAIGSVKRQDLRRVSWLLATLVLLMTATLHSLRHAEHTSEIKAAVEFGVD